MLLRLFNKGALYNPKSCRKIVNGSPFDQIVFVLFQPHLHINLNVLYFLRATGWEFIYFYLIINFI
ncbi:hypothetical protein M769_0114600 [Bacillus haynesii]|nr:hypothetical protein M769_0114600 [Bacillus haynesii]